MLSRVLSRVKKSSELVTAFAAYDGVRRQRAQRVVQTSREAGDIFSFRGKGIGDDMVKIVDNMNERFLWIWEHDIVADADTAAQNFTQQVLKAPQKTTPDGLDPAKESVTSISSVSDDVVALFPDHRPYSTPPSIMDFTNHFLFKATPPGAGTSIWTRIMKWIRSVFRLPWN